MNNNLPCPERTPSTSEFLNSILRTDFKSFFIKAFLSLNPASQYIDGWYIDALADYLMAIENGSITRLIVNMPPRYLKSLCINVAWSAWLLGQNPSRRIISASYSERISTAHSLNTRYLMLSKWYCNAYPHVVLQKDQNEKHCFQTTAHGLRFATSVGGSLTGEGGDFLILDDPINPLHSCNESVMANTAEWFKQIFMTRLNNRQKGVVVVVMQRLNKCDLSSILLEQKHWEHLNLPLIAEKKQTIRINNYTYYRKKNELLNKKYQNRQVVQTLQKEVGCYNFAAQYQQNPMPKSLSVFKEEWLDYFKPSDCPDVPTILSWDTAASVKKHANYSACSAWRANKGNFYLLYVYRAKLTYPALRSKVSTLAKEWNAKTILIENKSSGQQLLQELSSALNLIPLTPQQSKGDRFINSLSFFENKKVLIPEHATWHQMLLQELLSFPYSKNTDQIDSITQYLLWQHTQPTNKCAIRVRGL